MKSEDGKEHRNPQISRSLMRECTHTLCISSIPLDQLIA